MGKAGLVSALVLLMAVASAGFSLENPVALLQESTEAASTTEARETMTMGIGTNHCALPAFVYLPPSDNIVALCGLFCPLENDFADLIM